MRVTEIRIHNMLGLTEFELKPGKGVTYVEGGNGTGKTSVGEALKAVFKGGHDATLLRKGASQGEAVLVFDDGMEITKRVREDDSSVTVKHPTFGAIAKPQSFLDKLVNALALDPLAFLTAPKKKRAEALLEVLPSTVTDEQLTAAGVVNLPPASTNGLERIEIAKKAAYDERTGVNRTAKEKRATIAQLEASLPAASSEGDPQVEEQAAMKEAVDLLGELNRQLDTIKKEEADRSKAVNDETDAAIRKLEADRTEKLATIRAQATTRRDEAPATLQPRITDANARAAAARARGERSSSDRRARAFIVEHQEAAKALEENSAALTTTLEKLEELRTAALANLPIKGVVVKDGDIYVDDVVFDRVNRARQIRVALNVARLRAGPLGLVCIDNIEALDDETREAFDAAAEKSGLEIVALRRTNGPLTTRVSGAAA